MIIDRLLRLSNGQAINTAGTHASTDVHDLKDPRDMGIADKSLKFVVQASTDILGTTGTETIHVAVQGSTDNSTYTTMLDMPAALVVGSGVAAGTRLFDYTMPRPRPGQALPRYLRFLYTTAGTLTQSGLYSAIVLDRQDYVAYPPGVVVEN